MDESKDLAIISYTRDVNGDPHKHCNSFEGSRGIS